MEEGGHLRLTKPRIFLGRGNRSDFMDVLGLIPSQRVANAARFPLRSVGSGQLSAGFLEPRTLGSAMGILPVLLLLLGMEGQRQSRGFERWRCQVDWRSPCKEPRYGHCTAS